MFSEIFVFLAPYHCQNFGAILKYCAPIDGKSAFLLFQNTTKNQLHKKLTIEKFKSTKEGDKSPQNLHLINYFLPFLLFSIFISALKIDFLTIF
jgi:hypothetical protein